MHSDFHSDDVSSSSQNAATPAASFDALGLAPPLLKAIEALGFSEPTIVQSKTIPAALTGGDWMVSSQTGSGKTAAFLLPALDAVIRKPMPHAEQSARNRSGIASPRILVLAPTRELAQQVASDAIDLVRFTKGIRIATIIGGTSYGKQMQDLRGAVLVVATPGRLLDLHRNRQISLDAVDTLIVDEADRMLDLGFSEDLEAIHVATMRRTRTMMFSATFAPRIMALAENVMRSPQKIALVHATDTHQNITQHLHWCDNNDHKGDILDRYLADPALVQAVVFTSTQIETDALADALRDAGHRATALHGGIPQAMRNRRLAALRDGSVKILVATDVAARGIDVPTISHVINYGLPMKSEDYTHRIGRTGRAGRDGIAITLATVRDRFKVRDIERYTQTQIKETVLEGLEPSINPWSKNAGRSAAPRYAGNREIRPRAQAPAENYAPRADFAAGSHRESRTLRSAHPIDGAPRSPRGDAAPRGGYRGHGDVGFRPRGSESRSPTRFENRNDHDKNFRSRTAEAATRFASADESAGYRTRNYGGRDAGNDRFGASLPRSNEIRATRKQRDDQDTRPRRYDERNEVRGSFPKPSYAAPAGDRPPRRESLAAPAKPAASRAPAKFSERRAAVTAEVRAQARGPAFTPPAPGGNRAARRAALQGAYAERMTADSVS